MIDPHDYPPDEPEWDSWRNKIIGLGEMSARKSYYPELQKKMEDLRISESNQRAIFDSTSDAILIHDDNGNVSEVNLAMLKMYCLTREEALSFNVKDFSAPGGQLERLDDIYANLRKGTAMIFEWVARRPLDGTTFDVEVSLNPVVWSGRSMIVAVVRDISERKRAENIIQEQLRQLEMKNAEMERFTYTVSHDLKSPLLTIKGFSGMLRLDVSQKKYDQISKDLARIENAADRMAGLLEDLLELSRIGRMINPISACPVHRSVEDSLELLTAGVQERNAKITVHAPMPTRKIDEIRMRQVWQNLIENALKFHSPHRPLEIQIGYDESDRFYVRDNGRGLDPSFKKTIFGLFEKLDPHSPGSGVGLALVKRIIELHGGTIWVESAGKDKGATFYFTLPPGDQ